MISDEMIKLVEGSSAIPVSYTHLDVYKRQSLVLAVKHYPVRINISIGNIKVLCL